MKRGDSAEIVKVDGRDGFRIHPTSEGFAGLDMELITDFDCKFNLLPHYLSHIVFTRPHMPDPHPQTTAFYAWFATRGEWMLSLVKGQQNAFRPMAMPEWLSHMPGAVIEAQVAERVHEATAPQAEALEALRASPPVPVPVTKKARLSGDDAKEAVVDPLAVHAARVSDAAAALEVARSKVRVAFGPPGGVMAANNSVLVAWMPPGRQGVPWPTTGNDAPKWRDKQNACIVYMVFGDEERIMTVSGSKAARNAVEEEKKTLELTVRPGSVVLLKGDDCATRWDVSFSCDSAYVAGKVGCYIARYQNLSLWGLRDELAAMPPVCTLEGMAREERVIPALSKNFAATKVSTKMVVAEDEQCEVMAFSDGE